MSTLPERMSKGVRTPSAARPRISAHEHFFAPIKQSQEHEVVIAQFVCEAGDLVFEIELAIQVLRARIGEYLRAQCLRERCGIAAITSDVDRLFGQCEAEF